MSTFKPPKMPEHLRPTTLPPERATLKADARTRFEFAEKDRLELAKELLLKGMTNITPEQAAEQANRLFWLVLSAVPPVQPDE
jgi:hypothetical protein